MPEGVMIRGRYVSKSKPIGLLVAAIVMGIIAGINLGIGINYNCWEDYWDSWCESRKNAYIISGSCFVISSVCFLVAAISLHVKIKEATRRSEAVLVQQGNVQHPPDVYPRILVTQYPPPSMPPTLPPTAPHNPAPIGFAPYQQPAPSVASYPPEYSEQQQQQYPPPYSP